ncbi:hypothetical protein J6590_058716 [Homalodisca vitripennis]|nr:hypothetical protein J6590_058716 [Homalodisca vitripennis]
MEKVKAVVSGARCAANQLEGISKSKSLLQQKTSNGAPHCGNILLRYALALPSARNRYTGGEISLDQSTREVFGAVTVSDCTVRQHWTVTSATPHLFNSTTFRFRFVLLLIQL